MRRSNNDNEHDKHTLRVAAGSDALRIERCRTSPERGLTAADSRVDPAVAQIIEICDADYRSFSLPCDAMEGEGGETLKEPSRPYGVCAVSLPASGCSDGPGHLCIQ